jgi:hypothetical protein
MITTMEGLSVGVHTIRCGRIAQEADPGAVMATISVTVPVTISVAILVSWGRSVGMEGGGDATATTTTSLPVRWVAEVVHRAARSAMAVAEVGLLGSGAGSVENLKWFLN